MRTTITLDPDVAALVRRVMAERSSGFKQVVNDALRQCLTGETFDSSYQLPSFEMGVPRVSLDKALQLAAELEDEERLRKLALRK